MSAERKAYPLRISVDVLDAIQHWADDELRRHVHGTVARRRAEARRHE